MYFDKKSKILKKNLAKHLFRGLNGGKI